MKEKIISIDQGTTSTRSVLYDKNGDFISSAQQEFNQFFPKDGWVEHNPEAVSYTHLTLPTILLV